MIDYLKRNHLSLLIIVYLLASSFFGGAAHLFGGAPSNLTTISNPWTFTSTGGNNGVTLASTTATAFKVGQVGTQQSNYITTTCAPKADSSIAASSTGYAYCTGVSGVTSSDYVMAQFATSSLNQVMNDHFIVVSATASSTAGSIDLVVLNLTGAAAVPSAVSRTASTTVIRAGH